MVLVQSSTCLIQIPPWLSDPHTLYKRMVPERRSRRAAARAVPHELSVSAEKQFSTPRKASTITKAEIKRVSAIFCEAEDHSGSDSSENNSQDCASENFVRRRGDPQLDTIRRKLNFSQKALSASNDINDFGFHSVNATFRARKVRGAEQKCRSLVEMVKSEPVDQAQKCGGFDVKLRAEVTSGPEIKLGSSQQRSKFRGDRTNDKLESVECSVKQELQNDVEEAQPPHPQRRKTSVRPEVKLEYAELDKVSKEEPKARLVLRRRKLDMDIGGISSGKKSKVKKVGDWDQFANKATTSASLSVSLPYDGPYPSHERPYPEECQAVRDLLSDLHGHLPEYERHKESCPTIEASALRVADESYDSDADGAAQNATPQLAAIMRVEKVQNEVTIPTLHPRERRTVLDSLVGTLLSQNTTDNNSRISFASLKRKFPTWEDVYKADPKDVAEAIRCGGLAEIKAARIVNILKALVEERGKICLEYMRSMSNEEIKTELSRFKGVGPKTVACVLMFHLRRNEFPVDTHVFRISKALGWVPAAADREKTYHHLNQRIPDHLKFDIHCLFVTHGKKCPHCAKRQTKKSKDAECPLVDWSSKVLKGRSEPSALSLKGSEPS